MKYIRLTSRSKLIDFYSSDSFVETNLSIGDRVIVSSGMGSRAGILHYIGETKFAPGNWCGVALDEPSGKNDGTVDGVQYVKLSNYQIINLITLLALDP